MIIRKLSIALSVWLLMAVSTGAAAAIGPKEQVKTTVDSVLEVVKNRKLDTQERQDRIGVIIREHFDFEDMSQRVLARNWQRATPYERRQFVDYFSQYLENTYMGKIEAYTDEQVLYPRERITGNRAVVDTVIVTRSADIPVNYKLKQIDGQWYAYDVIIEGVSLINSYRDLYAAIIRNEGMDGLLSNIQTKIDAYKREKAQAVTN